MSKLRQWWRKAWYWPADRPLQRLRKQYAFCCGQPLSEWFVDPTKGMRCLLCGRTWPFITHAEYWETQHKEVNNGL